MNRLYRQLQAEETALLRGVGSGSEMLLKELEHAKANVQEGSGLGSRFYSSPEILNLEREAVFLKAWQFAVHENQVEQPNSYALARLGEFEVVVTRDGSEGIRAFQNMCLHRGSRLVACDGQAKTLVCPYHSWSYSLDGTVRKAPGFDGDPRVNPGESRIRRANVDRLGPLLFASLSSDPIPFSEVIGPIKDIFADAQRLRREDSRQYSYGCNWKTGIENSLECYHCPTIHPGFNDLIDLKNYLWELRGFCGITGGQLRAVPRSGVYSAAVAHEDSQTIGRYYYVWPNLQLLRYPGPPNLTIARWLPRGVDRTVCIRDFYFGDEFSATQREEFIQYVEEIQEQDIRICENVQGNVQSNAFQKSILRLTEDGMGEHGIRQFQLLLLEAFRTHLSGLAPSARATVQ